MYTLIIIGIPLLGALVLFAAPTRQRWWEPFALIVGVVEFVCAMIAVFAIKNAPPPETHALIAFDALGLWFLAITATLGMLALLYSQSYLGREEPDIAKNGGKKRRYYALFHLFLFAMFLAAGANNILLLWIAVEATTLCSAFLVNFFDRPAAIEAAWKYMIINTVALLLGLFGLFFFIGAIENATTTIALDWESIAATAASLDVSLVKLAFVFVVIGYGTKAGLAPLHNWLPDAHSQAPSPVSAMLSGALLNIAMLALLRFKKITDLVTTDAYSQKILLALGLLSITIAALFILTQKRYKRLLAYSSVEHMGIVAFGFAMGGVGSIAALLHSLFHSLAKSLLFLTSGNILLRYRAHEIGKISGLLTVLPVTGFLFLAGILAVAGIPPFGTFMTEFIIFSTSFDAYPVFTVIALVMLAVAFVGFLRHISTMCFGKSALAIGEDDRVGLLPLIATFIILFVLSVLPPPFLINLLNDAALGI